MRLTKKSHLWGVNLLKLIRLPKVNQFPDVIGTFMARDAFALAVTLLSLGREDAVLLPAYLCREVLKPFIGKTQVRFYDVKPDLTVDPAEIEKSIAANDVKAVVIINYFGFLQPYRAEIKRILSVRNIALIEDCAHSFLTKGSGETGDISIFSFRKLLPVPDGGGLKVASAQTAMTSDFHPRLYSNVLSALALLKSLLGVQSELLSRAGLSSQPVGDLSAGNSGEGSDRFLPLSSFARNGIGNCSFHEIIEKRRNDYLFWQGVSRRTSLFRPVFDAFDSGVCPMGCPVLSDRRDAFMERLLQLGITAKIHWRLPEDIESKFANSRELSAKMLTLPVYPELTWEDREKVSNALGSLA
jgi:hypothetical protein